MGQQIIDRRVGDSLGDMVLSGQDQPSVRGQERPSIVSLDRPKQTCATSQP
jgi:hypothetical protein